MRGSPAPRSLRLFPRGVGSKCIKQEVRNVPDRDREGLWGGGIQPLAAKSMQTLPALGTISGACIA